MNEYDVVVIGGGHAGCEAASAAARMGARIALVTFAKKDIGAMSCNPAIGGLGKGHIVREIDALDGIMARAADQAAIHYRMLNRSKGKAVQGPRVQADRLRYARAVTKMLAADAIDIVEDEAVSLVIKSGSISGVRLASGVGLTCHTLVIATGTFLNARMFSGSERTSGGRNGDPASVRMADQFRDLGLPLGRLKTGTPPRLDGRTIDWSRLTRQESDREPWTMSALSDGRPLPQLACAVTRTNARTHDLIRDGLIRSPLHSAEMTGAGPRYCPSIEDKVRRFGDRDGHQIFLEPEGLDTSWIYPNGISTSLSVDDQLAFVRSIDGLERAEIVRAGYAVEYDHVDSRALGRTLALTCVSGLFLAGQINGTTGYEEAAGQGLVAGLNAAALALGREPILFDRTSSYLGVMIDDLTVQGVTEPYRMLTARAEFRLHLRADNAHARLERTGRAAGCLGGERLKHYERRTRKAEQVGAWLAGESTAAELDPDYAFADRTSKTLAEWMRHPGLADRVAFLMPDRLRGDIAEEMLENARYAPYLRRQSEEVKRISRDRQVALARDLRFGDIAGLSNEMVQRLELAKPESLDEAARVRGITPAALSAILVAARRLGA